LLLAWEVRRCRRELHALQGKSKAQQKWKDRPPVVITADDRTPPERPIIRALRENTNSTADSAMLIRCDPKSHRRSGAAILILPGGNYDNCNLRFPLRVASWMSENGLVAYVLRYRLRSEGHYWPAQEEDCKDALSIIRQQAKALNVDPGKVGVIGFSAGGHLASVAATMFDADLKPNFQILVYATTNVETPLWDPWKARDGYPGPELNTVDKVNAKTPPLFAAVSTEDNITSYEENTRPYIEACQKAGVSTELVFKPMGQHGHAMVDTWTKPCEGWLHKHGWAVSASML